ncbi:MAG: serine/threonine protein kinase [Kofleriaceae bacterium]
MIGEVIGNYRIEAVLGQGGMGVVYRGEHVLLGRAVAVKMLQPSISNDAAMVQRFFNEARAASAIDHPGIVEIFDFGTHTDGRAFIAMALLQGESLEGRLRRAGPIPALLGASLLAQVVSALAAAHARGIVHRDLKPDNIFLVPNEMMPDGLQVKLLDFGIAKLANDQSSFKTQTGALIGTPAYMSPEQCMGASDLDHRTDIYSLGCILFHVLTGRPPFKSDHGTGMLIAAHLRDEAPDVRSLDPNIPESLAWIVRRCLEKEKTARFQTALELRQALVDAGAHSPTQPGQSVPRNPSAAVTGQRFTGAEAYGQTVAPGTHGGAITTNRSAAAQLVPEPAQKPRSSAPVVFGVVALVALLASGGVFLAMRGGGTAATQADSPTPPAPVAIDAGTQVAIALDAGTQIAVALDAAVETGHAHVLEPCPDGQERTADTAGNCCWRDQAWSSAKKKCIGAPRCPDGTEKKGEGCIQLAKTETPKTQNVIATPGTPVQAVTTFALADATVAPSSEIVFKFPARVASPTGDQSWVSISAANSKDTSYISWSFVGDKASSASLKGPPKPGDYEARLYTHYPTQSYNVVHRIPFKVEAPAEAPDVPAATRERLSLASTSIAAGAKIEILFPGPMIAKPGEKYWVTVVKAGAADSAYDAWEYVVPNARRATLPAPATAGSYEVRLHANYPAKTTNVVFRAKLTVE